MSEPSKPETAEVKNLPDFSDILGCFVEGDEFIHLGQLFSRITACGRGMSATILSRDVTVTCPECVAELKYRAKHHEAARKEMGIVTHKEEVKDASE